MTKYGLLNTIEALEYLGLYDPDGKAKPNHRYLKHLADWNMLQPIKYGHRTYRYDMKELEKVMKNAKKGIIKLKPGPKPKS